MAREGVAHSKKHNSNFKTADPNSKRSKSKAKRNFKGSRPVRRAAYRLDEATRAYEGFVKRGDPKEFTKPGAQHHW